MFREKKETKMDERLEHAAFDIHALPKQRIAYSKSVDLPWGHRLKATLFIPESLEVIGVVYESGHQKFYLIRWKLGNKKPTTIANLKCEIPPMLVTERVFSCAVFRHHVVISDFSKLVIFNFEGERLYTIPLSWESGTRFDMFPTGELIFLKHENKNIYSIEIRNLKTDDSCLVPLEGVNLNVYMPNGIELEILSDEKTVLVNFENLNGGKSLFVFEWDSKNTCLNLLKTLNGFFHCETKTGILCSELAPEAGAYTFTIYNKNTFELMHRRKFTFFNLKKALCLLDGNINLIHFNRINNFYQSTILDQQLKCIAEYPCDREAEPFITWESFVVDWMPSRFERVRARFSEPVFLPNGGVCGQPFDYFRFNPSLILMNELVRVLTKDPACIVAQYVDAAVILSETPTELLHQFRRLLIYNLSDKTQFPDKQVSKNSFFAKSYPYKEKNKLINSLEELKDEKDNFNFERAMVNLIDAFLQLLISKKDSHYLNQFKFLILQNVFHQYLNQFALLIGQNIFHQCARDERTTSDFGNKLFPSKNEFSIGKLRQLIAFLVETKAIPGLEQNSRCLL